MRIVIKTLAEIVWEDGDYALDYRQIQCIITWYERDVSKSATIITKLLPRYSPRRYKAMKRSVEGIIQFIEEGKLS